MATWTSKVDYTDKILAADFNAIQTLKADIKKATAVNLGTLDNGEFGLETDTRRVLIGSSMGNQVIKGDYVTPEMYGAKGDGVTDDTAAVQASVNAVTNGGTWVGVGDYKTTSLITIQDIERATFILGGKIINTASSVLRLDNLVRCKIDGLSIIRNPYDWSPAHTGIEISGKFWNNSVGIRIIEGFEKGIYLNSDDANGIAWTDFYLGNIYDCKYGIYIANTDATNGWCNANNIHGGAISIAPATKAAEVGTCGIYFGDYGAHFFNAYCIYGTDFESLHTAINLDHVSGIHILGGRTESCDTTIKGRSCSGLSWFILDDGFNAALIDFDDTVRGVQIVGNNTTTGGAYGMVNVEGPHSGVSVFDPQDIANTKWRLSSDVGNYAGLLLSSPLSTPQVLNKQQEGSATPTTGTYAAGAVVWNISRSPGQPVGWVCDTLGTMGTLNSGNTTGTCISGSKSLVVSSSIGLQRGQRINVAADAGGYAHNATVIDFVSGTIVTMATDSVAAATGKAVSYYNATWKALPGVYDTQGLLTTDTPQFDNIILGDLTSGAIPYAPLPVEKVANGDFETWASATDAGSWTEHTPGTSTINRDATGPHGGTYCARFDIDASNSVTYEEQTLTLTAAGKYTLVFWNKTTGGATSAVVLYDYLGGNYLQSDGSWLSSYAQITLAASAVWAKTTIDFIATANTSYRLQLLNSSAASLSIYWDDISVLETVPLADSPLSTDGTDLDNSGVYKVDGVQVVSNRVVDARLAATPNSGDATTDGLIDALRDLILSHGLGASS